MKETLEKWHKELNEIHDEEESEESEESKKIATSLFLDKHKDEHDYDDNDEGVKYILNTLQ